MKWFVKFKAWLKTHIHVPISDDERRVVLEQSIVDLTIERNRLANIDSQWWIQGKEN